jgi:hypothetical protein
VTISRRSFLGAAAAVPLLATSAKANANAYGGLRIAKPAPTTATTPEITLPDGYSLVTSATSQFASPWQYYAYVQGPPSSAIPVTISWPGEVVETVISKSTRLPISRSGNTVSVDLAVTDTKIDAANLQIRSAPPTDASIFFRLEHNDPGRAAGVWAAGEWPTGPVRAATHFTIAAERILRDSGLSAIAAARGHTYYVTGFETYTTLHADNPPHWHLGYYPGPRDTRGSYMPHLWMDEAGRIFYNGLDIDGVGVVKYHAGEPAALKDTEGTTVVTLTIRTDGGLDVDPPGGPRYSITPAGTPADGVVVLKDGQPWLDITARDYTLAGALTVTTQPGGTTVHRYDRHIGTLQ